MVPSGYLTTRNDFSSFLTQKNASQWEKQTAQLSTGFRKLGHVGGKECEAEAHLAF